MDTSAAQGVAAAPNPRWNTGAKVLAWIGGAMLALSFLVGAPSAGIVLHVAPTGIITPNGEPGNNALASGEAPGSVEIELNEGDAVVVWEVRPSGEDFDLFYTDVEVETPGGPPGTYYASFDQHVSYEDYQAHNFAQFRAPEDGNYTVTVDGSTDSAHAFVLAYGPDIRVAIFAAFLGFVVAPVLIAFAYLGSAMFSAGVLWGSLARERQR